MNKIILVTIFLIFALFSNICCTTSSSSSSKIIPFRTELDKLFDNDFKGYQAVEPDRIKQSKLNREYSYTTIEDVWSSAISLIMQRGVIINADKQSGIIVCFAGPPTVIGKEEYTKTRNYIKTGFPSAILIEEHGHNNVIVYADWLEELYSRLDKPEVKALGIKRQTKKYLATIFFDMLSVQIFSKNKWKYLYGK
jgi:hypothetical protein